MTTPILGIIELALGQVDQFATANEAFRALEAAGNDVLAVNLASGNATLSAAQFSSAALFRSSGNTIARSITVPASKRLFAVQNGGSFQLSVIRGSTTVGVAAGRSAILFSDGTTNGLAIIAGGVGGIGATDVAYNNSGTGLLSTDVQGAINELAAATVGAQCIAIACGDETTPATTGTAVVTFRMPYAFTVQGVRASLTTAQATSGGGGLFTVDINEGGVSILSTKLTIDNTEKTSVTAATPPVISDASLADDAEITIDIDQIGDSTAAGLKIYLIGVPA